MAQAPNMRNLSVEDFQGDDGLSKLVEALNPLISSVSTGMNKGLSIKDNTNAVEKEFTVTVPKTKWIEVATFSGTWANYNAVTSPPTSTNLVPARYRIDDDGYVHMQGMVKSGATLGSTVHVLPVGYRPDYEIRSATHARGADGILYVLANGNVNLYTTNTDWASLDRAPWPAVSPAAPPVFEGAGWPALVDSGQGGVIHDVKLVYIKEVNGSAATSHGGCAVQWEPGPAGKIIVRRITRLTPERTYKVKLLLYPES